MLDEFSERPVSNVDQSLDQKGATDAFGSRAGARCAPLAGCNAAHT
jgi:hypothetical protein